jgi:hypothetical protein
MFVAARSANRPGSETRLARRLDGGDRVGVDLLDGIDRDPPEPLEGDLDRVAGEVDPLVDAGGDADPADELVGLDRLVVVPRGDDEGDDHPGLLVGPQQREVLRRPHLHRDRPQRVHDRRAERHQRQGGGELRAEDVVLALIRLCHFASAEYGRTET